MKSHNCQLSDCSASSSGELKHHILFNWSWLCRKYLSLVFSRHLVLNKFFLVFSLFLENYRSLRFSEFWRTILDQIWFISIFYTSGIQLKNIFSFCEPLSKKLSIRLLDVWTVIQDQKHMDVSKNLPYFLMIKNILHFAHFHLKSYIFQLCDYSVSPIR